MKTSSWKSKITCLTLVATALCMLMSEPVLASANSANEKNTTTKVVLVVEKNDRSPLINLAAQEVRRYLYLRTGHLFIIKDQIPAQGNAILFQQDNALGKQQYRLKTTSQNSNSKLLSITGGSELAVLYGAYYFAEKLGVRFYLHGDVIPDEKITFSMPDLDEVAKPLFEIRGIQPFHDFAEGPDWWDADDYKAYCSQLAKLRMNFMGLHCYPEDVFLPEPGVWIGLPEDVNPDGTVRFSPASDWISVSGGGRFEYVPTKTSDFAAGAGMLFAGDDFGSPVTNGNRPLPKSLEGRNAVFNRTGQLFNEAFTFGHSLGIKFCMGTETPLTIPKALKARLREKGFDPESPKVVCKLYEGMFRRIALTHPLDYYWLWTPEPWTWDKIETSKVDAAVKDIKLAMQGLEKAGKPFEFATSGWVLGPPNDRALLDEILPKQAAVSCINRILGFDWVDPSFATISDRQKWAIPWMEDDVAMVLPQLWAGRIRRDAADAYAYGCTGLLGIHWRTKILSPNISALAQAGWDQKDWNPDFGKNTVPPERARCLAADDFYADWANTQFGASHGKQLGQLFAGLDGGRYAKSIKDLTNSANLPRPTTWIDGPGNIIVNSKDWSTVKHDYDFVDQMAAMRDQVTGKGNLERFDYWLNNFRYLRAVGYIGCLRGQLDKIVKQIDAEKNPAEKQRLVKEKALPVRIELARAWEQMMGYLLQTVSTPGEIGTVANLEQHVRRGREGKLLNTHDKKLNKALGSPLPPEVEISKEFHGDARLIVPTKRTQIHEGEPLTIKMIVLDSQPPKSVSLCYRSMGQGKYKTINAVHLGRGVYTVTLPQAPWAAIEYYAKVTTAKHQPLLWPSTAPDRGQTVVVTKK